MRMEDGSLKITWITNTRKPEKLMIIDSGLHPVEVPDHAIQESLDTNAELPSRPPIVLDGFGQNTAFVRDLIDLRPLPK